MDKSKSWDLLLDQENQQHLEYREFQENQQDPSKSDQNYSQTINMYQSLTGEPGRPGGPCSP